MNMTLLVVWAEIDTHGPSSIFIASDKGQLNCPLGSALSAAGQFYGLAV